MPTNDVSECCTVFGFVILHFGFTSLFCLGQFWFASEGIDVQVDGSKLLSK